MIPSVVVNLGWVDLDLGPTQFCSGRCEFGRIDWAARLGKKVEL